MAYLPRKHPPVFAYVLLLAGCCANTYAQATQFGPKSPAPTTTTSAAGATAAAATARAPYLDPLEDPIILKKTPANANSTHAAAPAPTSAACRGKGCRGNKAPAKK